MKQDYSKYTAEDQEVWKILYDRQVDNLQDKAHPDYLECLGELKGALDGTQVPDFQDVDKRLMGATGWSIEVVPGLIPVRDFFELLSHKRFCSSTWLRSRAQLDYLEEPDMFHDTFGHIPLLIHEDYAAFMQKIGEVGVKYSHDQNLVDAMERLYWFTIEFGLMKGEGKPLIYGAGIISSFGETHHIYDNPVKIYPYDIDAITAKPFDKSVIQDDYFLVNDFSELFHSLEEFEGRIG